METIQKNYKDLSEGEIIRYSTGDGPEFYVVDDAPTFDEDAPAYRSGEVWITRVDENMDPAWGEISELHTFHWDRTVCSVVSD